MAHVDDNDLKALAPYEGEAFREGIARLLESPLLPAIVSRNFPKVAFEEFRAFCRTLRDADTFQDKIITVAIRSLLRHTSSGLTTSGLERLDPRKRYVFISNHRDIICDPALFSFARHQLGYRTTKILLGDNLLTTSFVTDLVKTNKGVTVKRDLSTRELFRWSQVLSCLIRHEIESGVDSVWIAQREGRAKDGDDRTHPGVLKMLTLSQDTPFLESLERLHLVPIAVSYEYDPCDAMKARELYLTERNGTYKKAPGEDVQSMVLGIRGFKGLIHIAAGKELQPAIERAAKKGSRKEQVDEIVTEIDRQIWMMYRNWTSNFIAFDLSEGKGSLRERYTPERKEEFLKRMERQIAALTPAPSKEEADGIRRHFIEMYANPIRNAIRARSE